MHLHVDNVAIIILYIRHTTHSVHTHVYLLVGRQGYSDIDTVTAREIHQILASTQRNTCKPCHSALCKYESIRRSDVSSLRIFVVPGIYHYCACAVVMYIRTELSCRAL